jgi:hypothetical protein
MMGGLQKAGGVAALIMPVTWVVVGVIFLVVLAGDGFGFLDADIGATEKVAILTDHRAIAAIGWLAGYVLWGLLQAVLALALYDRLKAGAPALAQVATAIGLMLATVVYAAGIIPFVGIDKVVELHANSPEQAGALWLAIESVQDGLTGTEDLTGLWILLISLTALRARQLPKALSSLGIVSGVAGLLTLIPPLKDVLVPVYALTQMAWSVWLGIVLLRTSPGRESRQLAEEAA